MSGADNLEAFRLAVIVAVMVVWYVLGLLIWSMVPPGRWLARFPLLAGALHRRARRSAALGFQMLGQWSTDARQQAVRKELVLFDAMGVRNFIVWVLPLALAGIAVLCIHSHAPDTTWAAALYPAPIVLLVAGRQTETVISDRHVVQARSVFLVFRVLDQVTAGVPDGQARLKLGNQLSLLASFLRGLPASVPSTPVLRDRTLLAATRNARSRLDNLAVQLTLHGHGQDQVLPLVQDVMTMVLEKEFPLFAPEPVGEQPGDESSTGPGLLKVAVCAMAALVVLGGTGWVMTWLNVGGEATAAVMTVLLGVIAAVLPKRFWPPGG